MIAGPLTCRECLDRMLIFGEAHLRRVLIPKRADPDSCGGRPNGTSTAKCAVGQRDRRIVQAPTVARMSQCLRRLVLLLSGALQSGAHALGLWQRHAAGPGGPAVWCHWDIIFGRDRPPHPIIGRSAATCAFLPLHLERNCGSEHAKEAPLAGALAQQESSPMHALHFTPCRGIRRGYREAQPRSLMQAAQNIARVRAPCRRKCGAWKHCATKVGKPRLDFGIGEARVDLRVELVANASTLGVLCWKSSRENIVSTANFLGR